MDAAQLIHMANQIARNLAVRGEAEAAAATATHIREFWDPRMIAQLLSVEPAALAPIARAALNELSGSERD